MNFLRQHFGKRWGRKILLIALLDFVIISCVFYCNWNSIQYNPAAFVQESVKTVLSLTVIYFIIEFQKYSTEKNKIYFLFKDFLKFQIIRPLTRITEKLELAKTDNDALKSLKPIWNKLYIKLRAFDLYEYDIDFKSTPLYDFPEQYPLEKINNFIKTFHGNSFEQNQSEYAEHIKYLEMLLSQFTKLNKDI